MDEDISSLGLGFSFLFEFRFLLQQLLSSFCDDETKPATTSPLLSSIHSYDFSFSLSSGSLWLAFSQPPCGRTSQPIEHETSLQSMVFQLAAHPPFPASDKERTNGAWVHLVHYIYSKN
ncbi:hypothetical protein Prudu_006880 [Prunus dulcis]|uniref:Uncharacterized protein n=1 Tax=Prunus dulcis TaxID=3755 RepID=A0A4Y1R0Q8_PRUDU|nr:hypothetical protein Prudu_006880 [Prunus dulcis]